MEKEKLEISIKDFIRREEKLRKACSEITLSREDMATALGLNILDILDYEKQERLRTIPSYPEFNKATDSKKLWVHEAISQIDARIHTFLTESGSYIAEGKVDSGSFGIQFLSKVFQRQLASRVDDFECHPFIKARSRYFNTRQLKNCVLIELNCEGEFKLTYTNP